MALPLVTDGPGEGTFAARVPADWSSGVGAQGGVALALAYDAARRVLPEPQPLRAVTAHFVTPLPLDTDVLLVPALERAGRNVSTVGVRVAHGGRVAVAATFTFAALASTAHDLTDARVPDVPGPDECAPWSGPPPVPFVQHVEIRRAGGAVPLSGSANGAIMAWTRLRDEPVVDVRTALVLADAPPPGLFARLTAPVVMPTVELTAHLLHDFDADPQPIVLSTMEHVVTGGGHSVDRGELWSVEGRPLAVYQQLRRVVG